MFEQPLLLFFDHQSPHNADNTQDNQNPHPRYLVACHQANDAQERQNNTNRQQSRPHIFSFINNK